MFVLMASGDYIPYVNPAALSVSCSACDRRTYYDAGQMCDFCRRRGWLPLISTVRARFMCKLCGARPGVRVIGPLKQTTPLPD